MFCVESFLTACSEMNTHKLKLKPSTLLLATGYRLVTSPWLHTCAAMRYFSDQGSARSRYSGWESNHAFIHPLNLSYIHYFDYSTQISLNLHSRFPIQQKRYPLPRYLAWLTYSIPTPRRYLLQLRKRHPERPRGRWEKCARYKQLFSQPTLLQIPPARTSRQARTIRPRLFPSASLRLRSNHRPGDHRPRMRREKSARANGSIGNNEPPNPPIFSRNADAASGGALDPLRAANLLARSCPNVSIAALMFVARFTSAAAIECSRSAIKPRSEVYFHRVLARTLLYGRLFGWMNLCLESFVRYFYFTGKGLTDLACTKCRG